MKIKSTNIAVPKTIFWNEKKVTTGIFKTPTKQPIYLKKQGVLNDEVSNKKNHGGIYKACYMFSECHYQYWKNLYPNLNWNWGIFGENLTVSQFNENAVYVGAKYQIGNALIQISQHREPCYKLGYKFASQQVLKQFIKYGYAGTYLSILTEGSVSNTDVFHLIEQPKHGLTVFELFQLYYAKTKNQAHLKLAINCDAIAPKIKTALQKHLK